jgi:photoactive yellow protein
MADLDTSGRDPDWYKHRWEELMDLFPGSDPENIIDRLRQLQVDTLKDHPDALDEVGLADSEDPASTLRDTFDRLQELRRETRALEEIRDIVDVSSSTDLVNAVEALHDRAETRDKEEQAFREAGFEQPALALKAIESMEQQLKELYGEKEATERTDGATDLQREGDTFDQLQALLAREEKLQRELGVSNPDAVIEMVEGLTDQLEDLYRDRDADISTDSIFAPTSSSSTETEEMLEEAFGVSDPEAITSMMYDLTDQLDELYAERERLAEFNLDGTDDALEMLKSMQEQLEVLYERQEEMSEQGIDGMDYALSVIESMESQLNEVYDERYHSAEQAGTPSLEEATLRLQELEAKISDLSEEKERLREKRNRLQAQFEALEQEFGTGDPEAISELVQSLENQLEEFYEEREQDASDPSLSADDPLLPEDSLARLEDLSRDELDALPAGVFRVTDEGIVQDANAKALRWPDAENDSVNGLIGANFFHEVAPGTNNDLFRGRFETGAERGKMDEQFLYTYVSAHASATNLAVHLHRKPDESATWIVFRVLEQY